MLRLAQQAKQKIYRVMDLRLYSYDKRVVTAAKKIKFAAMLLGIQAVGPRAIPTRKKRWAVLRSPFKYKRSQEHYEICTHIRSVTIATDVATAEDFLKYVKETMYPGVSLKVTKYCFEPLEKYYVSPYLRGMTVGTDPRLSYEKVWPSSPFPPPEQKQRRKGQKATEQFNPFGDLGMLNKQTSSDDSAPSPSSTINEDNSIKNLEAKEKEDELPQSQ
jgi:ribosomal protein S10